MMLRDQIGIGGGDARPGMKTCDETSGFRPESQALIVIAGEFLDRGNEARAAVGFPSDRFGDGRGEIGERIDMIDDRGDSESQQMEQRTGGFAVSRRPPQRDPEIGDGDQGFIFGVVTAAEEADARADSGSVRGLARGAVVGLVADEDQDHRRVAIRQ